LLLVVVAAAGAPVALAQEGEESEAPPAAVPEELTLSTLYPVQEVALGENVTFEFTLRGGQEPQIARLEVQDLPEGWTAHFRGGGDVIRAAYVEPETGATFELRVEPPAGVEAGTYGFTVVAEGDGETSSLPIELIVAEKVPPRLAFEVDLPTLRGAPDSTFRYDVSLKNEGDEDLSVNLTANTPPGFQAAFKLSGKDVTNVPLAANENKSISVEVQAFGEVPAGDYPVTVVAQGGDVQAETTVTAEVTGQSQLNVTGPDGRLSGEAFAGDTTPLKLVVQNTGSAPAHNIELSATSPNGWQVDFEPKQLAELPAGEQVEVTAHVQPSEQAVAGDYVITMRAQPEEGAAKSTEYRVTVLTSTMWGVAGLGLIAVAVVMVGLAVMRFGRR
jgi:uncharacterized membrane protein